MGDAITNNENEQGLNAGRGSTPLANVGVTNPAHYADNEGIIEPIDRIANVCFNFGNAYKYQARLGLKGGNNTEDRDAKATIWYAADLVHRFMAEEDGEYRPTTEDIAEFDVREFITRVGVFAESVESALKLSYAGYNDMQKRFVLAAQDMLIQKANNAIKIGMSDRQYREFVLESIVVSNYTANYAMHYAPESPPSKVYNGAKSFPMSAERKQAVSSVMRSLDAKGLFTEATRLQWGFGATADHIAA